MTSACFVAARPGWHLERVPFALAGGVTLRSAFPPAAVPPRVLALTALIAADQWVLAASGARPASLVLGRSFGLRSSSDSNT